jgi:hypothetical protein
VEKQNEGLALTLLAWINKLGEEQGRIQSGGERGRYVGIVLTALVVIAIVLLVVRRRRNWRAVTKLRPRTEQELAELRRELAEGASPEALQHVRRAERTLAYARKPRDLVHVEREIAAARGARGPRARA